MDLIKINGMKALSGSLMVQGSKNGTKGLYWYEAQIFDLN